MRKEIRLLIASVILLAVGLVGFVIPLIFYIDAWLIWIFTITFFGGGILFTIFLFINEKIIKIEYSRGLEIRRYRNAFILCIILFFIGVFGVIFQCWWLSIFAYVVLAPMAYSFVGYYNAIKREK
jgi:hypothetical protein